MKARMISKGRVAFSDEVGSFPKEVDYETDTDSVNSATSNSSSVRSVDECSDDNEYEDPNEYQSDDFDEYSEDEESEEEDDDDGENEEVDHDEFDEESFNESDYDEYNDSDDEELSETNDEDSTISSTEEEEEIDAAGEKEESGSDVEEKGAATRENSLSSSTFARETDFVVKGAGIAERPTEFLGGNNCSLYQLPAVKCKLRNSWVKQDVTNDGSIEQADAAEADVAIDFDEWKKTRMESYKEAKFRKKAAEKEKRLAAERERQLAAEKEKQLAAEKEKQLAAEREKQLAAEREKQLAAEREKQLAAEREKQLAAEREKREKQLAAERERQLAVEREKQLAAEREKQLAIQREKKLAAERKQQLAAEKERHTEKGRQAAAEKDMTAANSKHNQNEIENKKKKQGHSSKKISKKKRNANKKEKNEKQQTTVNSSNHVKDCDLKQKKMPKKKQQPKEKRSEEEKRQQVEANISNVHNPKIKFDGEAVVLDKKSQRTKTSKTQLLKGVQNRKGMTPSGEYEEKEKNTKNMASETKEQRKSPADYKKKKKGINGISKNLDKRKKVNKNPDYIEPDSSRRNNDRAVLKSTFDRIEDEKKELKRQLDKLQKKIDFQEAQKLSALADIEEETTARCEEIHQKTTSNVIRMENAIMKRNHLKNQPYHSEGEVEALRDSNQKLRIEHYRLKEKISKEKERNEKFEEEHECHVQVYQQMIPTLEKELVIAQGLHQHLSGYVEKLQPLLEEMEESVAIANRCGHIEHQNNNLYKECVETIVGTLQAHCSDRNLVDEVVKLVNSETPTSVTSNEDDDGSSRLKMVTNKSVARDPQGRVVPYVTPDRPSWSSNGQRAREVSRTRSSSLRSSGRVEFDTPLSRYSKNGSFLSDYAKPKKFEFPLKADGDEDETTCSAMTSSTDEASSRGYNYSF